MATEQDAARDRVLAARAELGSELQRLAASGRAAVDIPAKIRRSPAKAAAVAGAIGFVALKGPQRLLGAARRKIWGERAPMPERMLPAQVEKTLRKLGDDGDKVGAALERDFADYAKKSHKERQGLKSVLLLAVARPLLTRAAKSVSEAVFSPDQQGFSGRLAEVRQRAGQGMDQARERAERAGTSAQDRIATVRREERGDLPDSPADETAPTGI